MENIEFTKTDTNPTIRSDSEMYELPFYKDHYYFMVLENYVNFIKGCEKNIRTCDAYRKYISELKDLGLTNCQVLGNVYDKGDSDKMATVEMHHGPIMSLFDYCGCLITYRLKHKLKINSFIIAKIIMQEHFAGNIQTIMLSKTAHQLVDSNKLFLNFKQAHGNINNFITKYRDGLLEDHVKKINTYIEMSIKNKSTDNNLFELKETITDWNRRRYY